MLKPLKYSHSRLVCGYIFFDLKESTMQKLIEILNETFSDELHQVILSNSKDKEKIVKVKIRPVLLKDKLYFQETAYIGTKVFHENYEKGEIIERVAKYLQETFKQGEIETLNFKAIILVSKKGKITVKKQMLKKESMENAKETSLSHNRKKQYLLDVNKTIDFLVDLGVQNKDGNINKSKYDKFKQINRYLEFVRDVLPYLDKEKQIRIIDFGCGKSYLTFALYYYLHEMLGYNLSVVGLDLKEDVIAHCNALSQKYGYKDLRFIRGDIATYEDTKDVDMVVSLHACDTATDYALQKAISWNAKVIFAVPCCQHEVNRQLQSNLLEPSLKYVVIKERIAALLTDAIRANLLEEVGYDTAILEFIDMEHTPKNLLIRAVKKAKMKKIDENKKLYEMTSQLHINTTLQKQLANGENDEKKE